MPTDVISVKDFGALGNGVADDTQAFQNFANSIGATGKRGYIPTGRYKLTKQVNFTDNCLVYGDGWKDVRDANLATNLRNWADAKPYGTIIFMAFQASTGQNAAFYVTGNSCIFRDIEFEAIQPVPGAGWASNNTPLAIYCYRGPFREDGGNGVLIENIMLRNLKDGIKLLGAARGTLRGIYGQCFGLGISVSQSYDVLRVEDVHLNWPFYSGQADVNAYMNAHAIALSMGRVDNPIINNFFCFGGYAGIKTYIETDPSFGGGGKVERLQASNVGIDNVFYGIVMEDAVTACLSNFYVYNRAAAGSIGLLASTNLGGGQIPMKLSLVNGDFQGSQAEALRFTVPGEAMLSNVRIRDYNNAGAAFPAINAGNGVTVQIQNIVVDTPNAAPVVQATGTGRYSGYYNTPADTMHTVRVFVGKCDGSGNVTVNHGIPNLPQMGLIVQGWHKSTSDGAMLPLTNSFVTNTSIAMVGGVANQSYRVTALYSPTLIAGW